LQPLLSIPKVLQEQQTQHKHTTFRRLTLANSELTSTFWKFIYSTLDENVLWLLQQSHRQIRSNPRPGSREADEHPILRIADHREGRKQIPYAAPRRGGQASMRRNCRVEQYIHRIRRRRRYEHPRRQPRIDLQHAAPPKRFRFGSRDSYAPLNLNFERRTLCVFCEGCPARNSTKIHRESPTRTPPMKPVCAV